MIGQLKQRRALIMAMLRGKWRGRSIYSDSPNRSTALWQRIARGFRSSASNWDSKRPGVAISSASILAIQRPLASEMPRFKARTIPSCCNGMTRIRESWRLYRSRISGVPSVLPSSRIRNSKSVNVWLSMLLMESAKWVSPFQTGMITEIRGWFMGLESGLWQPCHRDQLLARKVVGGLLFQYLHGDGIQRSDH